MLLGLLRFLRGSVEFSVSGRFPERFINMATKNGFRIWNTTKTPDGLTAQMYRSDYPALRRRMRQSGLRLKLRKKRGLPIYVRRYRERPGLFVGAAVFALTVAVMSCFIWSYDITGLDCISESEMQEALSEEGFYIGAFKPMLNYSVIARNLMLKNRDIGWMAINVTGSYASVEVKEESPAPEVADRTQPANIKAKCDGVIERMQVSEGSASIIEGSGVVGGQLLVSGVIDDQSGGTRLVRADAVILAHTVHQASFTVDSTPRLVPSGSTAQRLRLGTAVGELPVRFGAVQDEYSVLRQARESPSLFGVKLPLWQVREVVVGMESATPNDNSIKEYLKNTSLLYEVFALSDCVVEGRDERLEQTDSGAVLTVSYHCIEDIAQTAEIGIDENTDRLRVLPTEG